MARLTDFIRGFFAHGDFIDISTAAYKGSFTSLYYKELAIKQAVSIITFILSKCEIKVYQDGEAAPKSPEYYAWNIAPNKNQSGGELLAKIGEEMLLCDHALVFEVGGQRFCADDFKIEKDGIKPYVFTNVSIDGSSLQNSFKRKDVLYFKLGNAELTKLIDNVYASYGEVMTLSLENFKQRNGSKWKLKISGTERARKDFKEHYANVVQKNLKAFFEATNSAYPQFEGYELTTFKPEILNDTKSADITALRKDIFDMVAGVYKIPLSIMHGQTPSETDLTALQTDCLEPIVKVIGTELTKQMFSFEQWQRGCRFEVDITNIEHLDVTKLATASEKLIGSGVMNIDEVRVRLFGLNALNTEQSTKYWITKNFADIEKMTTGETGGGAEI